MQYQKTHTIVSGGPQTFVAIVLYSLIANMSEGRMGITTNEL
jgi:hypothetical protein